MAAFAKSSLGRVRDLLGGKQGTPAPVEPDELLSAQQEQQQAVLLLRDYEQSGLGWFWSTNAEGQIVYLSQSIAKRLGKTTESLIGQPFHSLFIIQRDADDAVERTLPLILSARKTFSALPLRPAGDAEEVWWSVSGRPQFSPEGEFIGYRGNGSDITESRRSQRDELRLAKYDSLTGLSNRPSMEKRLDATLTAFTAAKRACGLMMMDLDRFKQVNDTLGHPAGDDLLKQVAQRLGQVIPGTCEIGRLGGDEFEVILPDIDDRGRLGEIAKKIIAILSQPYSVLGSRCVIGASVGIAIAPYDGINREELVRSADLALYAAKDGGRGQFRFYSADLNSEAERRRQIEEDLRSALSKGQISLAYQPIVGTEDGRVVSLEAMLRWHHPEFGEVVPAIFVPVAEKCNLMSGLGDWALKQACEDAQRWPGSACVAVNITPAQFHNPQFPALVTQALANSGLPPQRLELELTEAIFSAEDQSTDEMLAALKMLGVRLVIDHFGTGNSSLAYLGKAPIDKIKIDQTFIRGLASESKRNGAIIKAIVSLAEELGMDTAAVGIEARDDLARMRELKLTQIQGDIYAQALGFEEAMEEMANGEWVLEPDGPSQFRDERRTVFRKVGLIHEDYRYEVMMRNLSRTGCMIEGLLDIPVGTQFVVDFGEGQLAVATVRRAAGAMQALEFEVPMVDDGAGGLVTRNRLSPYVLATAGMPLGALPRGSYPLGLADSKGQTGFSMPKFAQVDDSVRKSASQG